MEFYLIVTPIIFGLIIRLRYDKDIPIIVDILFSILILFGINIISTINIGYIDPFYAIATIYASPIPLILFLILNISFNYIRYKNILIIKYLKVFAYSFFIQTIILFIIFYIVERVAQYNY